MAVSTRFRVGMYWNPKQRNEMTETNPKRAFQSVNESYFALTQQKSTTNQYNSNITRPFYIAAKLRQLAVVLQHWTSDKT